MRLGDAEKFFHTRFAAAPKSEGISVVDFNAWENDCGDDPMIMLATLLLEEADTLPADMKTSLVKAFGGMAVFAGKNMFTGIVEKFFGHYASQEITGKCAEVWNFDNLQIIQRLKQKSSETKSARNLRALCFALI